jgi:hypothetical protein
MKRGEDTHDQRSVFISPILLLPANPHSSRRGLPSTYSDASSHVNVSYSRFKHRRNDCFRGDHFAVIFVPSPGDLGVSTPTTVSITRSQIQRVTAATRQYEHQYINV